jgi:hypothetical protein
MTATLTPGSSLSVTLTSAMLRNVRTLVGIVAVLVASGLAGCGDDAEPGSEGVRFAVYDSEGQLGERVEDGSFRCGPPRALCPPALIEPTGTYGYEPEGEPALDETAVVGAGVDVSQGDPVVTVDLTMEGAQRFQELTKRIADAGRQAGRLHHAAIVVGDEIVALASVDPAQYPDGIGTSQLQFFAAGQADAEAIAARINGENSDE